MYTHSGAEQPLDAGFNVINILVFVSMFPFSHFLSHINDLLRPTRNSLLESLLAKFDIILPVLVGDANLRPRDIFLLLICFILSQVYVIGEEGILEELKLAGFTGIGGPVRSAILQADILSVVDLYYMSDHNLICFISLTFHHKVIHI